MKLYEQHENLIVMMASAYKKKWSNLDYDDLYQEASIALWKAEESYNEQIGSFKNHALKQMKCYLLKFLYKQNQLHTPKNVIDTAAVIKRLELENERPDVIVEYIHKDVNDVINALHHLKVNNHNNFSSIEDANNDLWCNDGIDEVVINVEFNQFLRTLNDREQRILNVYRQTKNTNKLAESFGISQAQASRLLSKVKSKYISYIKEVC